MHEEVLNKLLRRADWRFLLPNPQPAKSVCFANGLLGKAVGLVSDCVVDAQSDPPGDCDLAVAIDPDHTTLRAAWTSLHPGGSCYTEWYSPLAGGLKGIRRRLEAAGFQHVTCYWCWPRPVLSRSEYWLPLEAPGALRYFLRGRAPARNVIHRLLRVAWLLCVRIGLIFPVYAIARKTAFRPGHEPSTAGPMQSVGRRPLDASGVTPDLWTTIRAHWQSWGFGRPPETFSSLMLTGGSRSFSKVVALVFAEPDHHPRLAVKMPRVPEAVPGLTREATTLRAIQSLRPSGVRGAPRVLFCQELAGLLTVGETALTGRPLSTLVRRNNYRDLALKATDWLSDLAGRSALCPRANWWDRLVEPLLADFRESFGPVIDPGMFRDTRDTVATLGSLPLVCEQRDFAPWNVLVTPDGELAVLDWESAELRGLPAQDLIYFLTHLAFDLDGAWTRESYRATLDPSTFTGRVVSECLARYISQIGLDGAAIGPLRLLVWLLHSRSEYQRFVADVAGRPEPRILRRSLFVSLWEEELRYTTRV